MRRRFVPLATAGALALALVARAEDFVFAGDQCFHHQGDVPAGATLERCGPLPQGEVVLWKFQSSAPLAAEIRQAGRSGPLHRVEASRGSGGQFIVPAAGRYCWAFVNPGDAAAAVAMELEHP